MRPHCRILPLVFFSVLLPPRLWAAPATSAAPSGSAPAPSASAPSASAPDGSAPSASTPNPAITPPELAHYEPAVLPAEVVVPEDTPIDLQLTIDAQGVVVDAVSLNVTEPQLSAAAVEAALKFRFTPARSGTEAVAVVVQYRFWFAATQAPAAAPAPTPNPAASAAPAPAVDVKAVENSPAQAPAPAAAPAQDEQVYEAVAEVKAPAREPTRRTIKQAELTQVPGTRGDPIRAIELLPGVGRAPEGSLPILRGAGQTESVTFLDGTSIPFLYHFGGVTSVVHPKLIEQVDLMPGNFSARYGRVAGGVIEAKLRKPRSDRLSVIADVNLIDSSLLVETPLGKSSSLALAGRRSNIDFVFENFVPSGTFNVVAAPVYWDYQAIFQHDLGADRFIRVAAFGANDRLKLVFDDPAREDPTLRGEIHGELGFHRLQVLHQTTWNKVKQRAHITLGTQNLEQRVGPTTAYLDLYEGDTRLEWEIPVAPAVTLISGVDASAQWLVGAYRGAVPQTEEGSPDLSWSAVDQALVDTTTIPLVNPAAYFEARIYPIERWLLLPGVRFDYFHQLRDFSLNPRLNQRFELTQRTTLKTGIGLYSQPPQYYEAMAQLGNPELNPYHALHTSAGVEHEVLHGLDVDAEAFYKYLYDRVVGTQGGAPPRFVNDGQGQIYGLELGASYAPSERLFARAAYTLSRSERQDLDADWRLFDQDQTHVLSIGSGYRLGAGWQIGGRYRYVTGNPTTPIVGATFDATRGVYVPSFGAVNSGRDPAFSQLDVRVEKQFQIGRGSLTAYLDVQNVLFTDNKQGFTYSYNYAVREGASTAPFLPNLGLRGEL